MGLPIIGMVVIFGVASWLLTRGIRRVIRLQFPRAHRWLDRAELAKFLLPLAVGASCATSTPGMIWSWFGVEMPPDASLYAIVWSKMLVGAGGGLASSLIYRGVRGWIRSKSSVPPAADVPPDADRP